MLKLMQGDCLELMKDIQDGSVDLVLTYPPYGTTACKWDSVIPFEPMWAQLKRVAKKNAAIVLFGSEPFSSALRMSNLAMFKYDWVWEKSRSTLFQHANKMPMKKHENICVFYKSSPSYNPQFTMGAAYTDRRTVRKIPAGLVSGDKAAKVKIPVVNSGTRFPVSVISGFFEHSGNLHPTQKPVSLLEYLIRTYSNEGETVLDFTMGSGSTGVACVNTNRNFIGIELDEGYYETAKKRIAEASEVKQLNMLDAM